MSDYISREAAIAYIREQSEEIGIHLSLEDARMITRSLSAASQAAGGGAGE